MKPTKDDLARDLLLDLEYVRGAARMAEQLKASPLRSRVTPFHDAACVGWAAAIRLALHERDRRAAAERVGIELAGRVANLGREVEIVTAERDAFRADLAEIGRVIGCGHVADGLARCVAEVIAAAEGG